METAISFILKMHEEDFNAIEFSKWISENKESLLDMEKELAETYANFCVKCEREGAPIILFPDFIKFISEE